MLRQNSVLPQRQYLPAFPRYSIKAIDVRSEFRPHQRQFQHKSHFEFFLSIRNHPWIRAFCSFKWLGWYEDPKKFPFPTSLEGLPFYSHKPSGPWWRGDPRLSGSMMTSQGVIWGGSVSCHERTVTHREFRGSYNIGVCTTHTNRSRLPRKQSIGTGCPHHLPILKKYNTNNIPYQMR